MGRRSSETPSERQVIWIVGRQGYEGKSWFQIMKSLISNTIIVRVDLRIKHANVCDV